ncbi:MAG: cytidine deaminase [Candidatus Melainabacteria bacterium]
MSPSLSPAEQTDLLNRAREAAGQAYAPYSDFPVGAALLCADGAVVTGVNVENTSYGLTTCAERNAIATAINAGQRRFVAMAVVALRKPHGAVTPCGACRQVLAEFTGADFTILSGDPASGQPVATPLAELLPAAFKK